MFVIHCGDRIVVKSKRPMPNPAKRKTCIAILIGVACNWGFVLFLPSGLHAQATYDGDTTDTVPQKDLIEVVSSLFSSREKEAEIEAGRTDKKVNFSLIPVAGASAPSGKVVVSSGQDPKASPAAARTSPVQLAKTIPHGAAYRFLPHP